jgi:hypothetical protein
MAKLPEWHFGRLRGGHMPGLGVYFAIILLMLGGIWLFLVHQSQSAYATRVVRVEERMVCFDAGMCAVEGGPFPQVDPGLRVGDCAVLRSMSSGDVIERVERVPC